MINFISSISEKEALLISKLTGKALKQTKKPKTQTLFLLIILMSIISNVGCKKLVEVGPPVTQITTETVFSNNASATSALINIYTGMSGRSFNIEWYTGLSGDELTNSNSFLSYLNLYTNSLSAFVDADNVNIWSVPYNFIYQANAIIEGLGTSTGVSSAVKQQLAGEAKFIRAYWHFYLVNLYGDVPLAVTSDYRVTSKLARSPKADVYTQIISDLKDAQTLLNSGFVDASDTTVYPIASAQRVRPTKSAAAALLARVYLYTGDYANAAAQASLVINNNTMFSLVSNLTNVFKKNSTEAIWQLMPGPTTYATQEGAAFILLTAPANNSYGVALNNQQLNAFEAGDNRRVNWVNSFTSGSVTYYYPYKFKADRNSTSQTEYGMMLRLAEQYLIRAEALTQQNKIPEAQADLNTIRSRAGLPNTTATTQPSLLAAIAHERQVELFTEWGDRWFNLKRTQTVDATMNVVAPLKGGTWKSFQQLYPIPILDIQNNPNLKQTTGY